MKVRPWRELERELPTRVRARVTARVEAELLAMDLRAIRAQLGKTQAELAEALGSSQSRVSDLERPGDHRLSTLRRYVEALGGELSLVARFGKRRVRLNL
jgi:transcriptional regulator with XRE-family HTH domain